MFIELDPKEPLAPEERNTLAMRDDIALVWS